MKTKSFTIVLLLCSSVLTAQNTKKNDAQPLDKATLRVTYQFVQKAMKGTEPIIITDTMTLDIGSKWSVYYDNIKIIRDSIHNANFQKNTPRKISLSFDQEKLESRLETQNQSPEISDDSKGESMLIFKNKPENILISFDKGPLEGFQTFTNFKLTEKINPHNWTITEDTCTILNYPCTKAVTTFAGRNYTAWFTQDIPLNDGPWRFYGLPGLILKIEDDKNIYRMEAVGLQKISPKKISFPNDKKVRECSRKELIQFRKNSFKNISINFRDGDNINSYVTKNPITYNELETIY